MQKCSQCKSLTHKKVSFLRRFDHIPSLFRVEMYNDIIDLEYDVVELVVG